MKNIFVVIGCIVLLLNAVLGLMISAYPTYNCLLNSGVIIVSTLLLILASTMKLKDGFRVSLSLLFPVCSVVEYICGLCAPSRFEDNICLVVILLLVLLQTIMLVLTNYLSRSNN